MWNIDILKGRGDDGESNDVLCDVVRAKPVIPVYVVVGCSRQSE